MFPGSSAKAWKTSAWTWGPFRAVNISRTLALGPLSTASLGGPRTVAPLAKQQEEIRPSPVLWGPRPCLGGGAGRGPGAAQRATRGWSPTLPPTMMLSKMPSQGQGFCMGRGSPLPRHTCVPTQSLCGHTNPHAQANTHMSNEYTQALNGTVHARWPTHTRCAHCILSCSNPYL